ncbi:unnamed protein product [Echinostoma caproni]|uniref:Uncharacterized protein n=1 Tax=Echinostoma caproni TaxID=27848 RepID=A0A183B3B4_9TREM|nr:unnamed protein product [Echinostoma caproni]
MNWRNAEHGSASHHECVRDAQRRINSGLNDLGESDICHPIDQPECQERDVVGASPRRFSRVLSPYHCSVLVQRRLYRSYVLARHDIIINCIRLAALHLHALRHIVEIFRFSLTIMRRRYSRDDIVSFERLRTFYDDSAVFATPDYHCPGLTGKRKRVGWQGALNCVLLFKTAASHWSALPSSPCFQICRI